MVALDGAKIAEIGTRPVPVEERNQLRAAVQRLARAGTGLQRLQRRRHCNNYNDDGTATTTTTTAPQQLQRRRH
jgi:hypothetical protein